MYPPIDNQQRLSLTFYGMLLLVTLCLVAVFSEAPVSELSLELLLLQVVLPALLEQGHTRQWIKGILKGWAMAAAYVL